MPDPYERHSRNSWEWGPVPARGQSRAAAAGQELTPEVVPEGKRPPAKKDPKLCKAQHWKGPHTPEFKVPQHGWRFRYTCEWTARWPAKVAWHCAHEEVCSGCGKVLSVFVGSRCPEFHQITQEEQDRVDAEIEMWAVRRSKRPVPVRVDGPQGYRKPKEGK